MAAIKALTALFLVLVGAAVAIHFIVSLFYGQSAGDTEATVWRILNPLMVAGVFIVMLLALYAKRRRDADSENNGVDRQYLEANFTYYFSIFLLLLLLWNWISSDWVDPPSDIGILWIFINSTLPPLLGAVGTRLLRGDSAFDCFPKK